MGYTLVSVPEALYGDVIKMVHRYLDRQRETVREELVVHAADEEVVHVPNQGDWTREMLRTVKDACPYDAPLAAIAAAHNAGRMTFYDEIVRGAGIPGKEFRARMGAFSKFTKKNFGEKTWPFEWGLVGDRLFYRMPAQLSAWWFELE